MTCRRSRGRRRIERQKPAPKRRRRDGRERSSTWTLASWWACRLALPFPINLPPFEHFLRQFGQKAAGALQHLAVAGAQAQVWVGEVKLVAGAGDRHIEQPPLLLHGGGRLDRAVARERALVQADHEHDLPFQALRLVHARKRDAFRVAL